MQKKISNHRNGKAARRKPVLPIAAAVAAGSLLLAMLSGCSASSVPADASPDSDVSSVSGLGSFADDTAVQESITGLLDCVERAEALVTQANAEVDEFADLEDFTEKTQKQTEVSQRLISDLAALQKQMEAVSCADEKFQTAVKEYFQLTYDSQKALMEIRSFFADYNKLYDDRIAIRPQIGNYDSLQDYYNALNTWYQSVQEGYAAITSCPACLEPQWKKYGEILDLNDSIAYKFYLANGYEDNLRYLSALNMSDRYVTAEELQYGELVSGLQGESNHFRTQGAYSFALADEIHAYAEMSTEERADYEFENIYTGKISLDYDAIDTIYPSLYNSYDAFLVVKTGCISGTRKILVEAEIEGLTQKYQETFTLDSAYKAIYIKPPALTGELNLSSAKDAQIRLTISEMDGTIIDAKTFPVTIKSKYDFEWYSDEYGVSTKDNILCFMAPESEAVAQLKRQAIEEISHMTDGQMQSFVGYQNNAWDNHYVGTYLQAAGIMRAMYEMGVRYNMDPFSISGSNQHILLPDDVLRQQSGLCIETSLVVASALQSAGMHVFLIFPPGHAQVAVEVWDGRGSNTVGTGEYFLIETTALSDNWEAAFQTGVNSLIEYKGPGSGPITYMTQDGWYEYISRDNTYLIDCSDASTLGMTPFAN